MTKEQYHEITGKYTIPSETTCPYCFEQIEWDKPINPDTNEYVFKCPYCENLFLTDEEGIPFVAAESLNGEAAEILEEKINRIWNSGIEIE